jgi:hypothetical protein
VGSCGVSAHEYSCAHGAQINFGDLTPYLTYGVTAVADAIKNINSIILKMIRRKNKPQHKSQEIINDELVFQFGTSLFTYSYI